LKNSPPDNAILFLYRDSALRRAALDAPPGDPARYSLYGADALAERGRRVACRIASPGVERRAYHWPGFVCDRIVRARGWPSGLFAAAFAMLPAIRRAAVAVSTVDALGIPLLWCRRVGLFSTPLVYISVGFPERVATLPARARALHARLLRRARAVIAFGFREAEELRSLLGPDGAGCVHFVPFGAHEAFSRAGEGQPEDGSDVLSVGADPQRDFPLLLDIASRRREWSFEVIVGGAQAELLVDAPPNVRVVRDLPIAETRDRMRAAKLIALPVRENSYSGATTTLLQAMAMGKPVVVSRTGAIRGGYGFADGVNLRWAEPGDAAAFERALAELLADPARARALGAAAARHVERELSWPRLVDRMERAIDESLRGARAA
jgi:glycosyltransferase involved in cell wall biosynthesis